MIFTQAKYRGHHQFLMMRTLAVLLLLLVVYAVALSTGDRERKSYMDAAGDKASLESLQQAILEGKVDIKELMANRENNPNRRLWIPWRGKK